MSLQVPTSREQLNTKNMITAVPHTLLLESLVMLSYWKFLYLGSWMPKKSLDNPPKKLSGKGAVIWGITPS